MSPALRIHPDTLRMIGRAAGILVKKSAAAIFMSDLRETRIACLIDCSAGGLQTVRFHERNPMSFWDEIA